MHNEPGNKPAHSPAATDVAQSVRLRVRPFQPADQAAARRLILDGLGEHFGFIDETLNPDLDEIAAHYIDTGQRFFVAELEGRIVGTAGLHFEPISPRMGVGEAARIVRMSVDRSNRRRGIASALVDACRQAAQEHGARELRAFTEPHWPDALGFYTSLGFVEYGRDPIDVHLRLSLASDRP